MDLKYHITTTVQEKGIFQEFIAHMHKWNNVNDPIYKKTTSHYATVDSGKEMIHDPSSDADNDPKVKHTGRRVIKIYEFEYPALRDKDKQYIFSNI